MQTPLRAPELEVLLSEVRLCLPVSWIMYEYQVAARRPLRECEWEGSHDGLQSWIVCRCRPSELAAWNGVLWPGSRFVHAASVVNSGSQNVQASLIGAWSLMPGLCGPPCLEFGVLRFLSARWGWSSGWVWAGVGRWRKGADGLGLSGAHVSSSTAASGTVFALSGSSWSGVRKECCI